MQKKVLLSILATICLGMSGFALSSCKKTEGNEGHVHTESVVISKDATCTETGSKHIECTVCGEVLQTEEIPALGHDYVDGVCTRCDEIDPDYKYTEGLEFTLNDAGTEYSVTDYTGSSASVVIPAKYNSLPVTSIGEGAFYECSSLTSIVIPSSVTSIGEEAFGDCNSLTSIEVAPENGNYCSIDGNLYSKDGKTLIQYAIGKTTTEFVIPSSVTSIGRSAFEDCSSLTSIVIPSSVTSIGSSAFDSCSSLTSASFGENSQLTSIGYGAFWDCRSLTSIVIPSSVTSIGWHVFYDCVSLTIYCEAESQPVGWDSYWNDSKRPVVWGYKKTN